MKKTIFILFLIAILPMTSFSQNKESIKLLREKSETDYVWVASHRGDWIYAPENSILALEHAIYFGANMIETDVRLTKDGKIIMMHDYTVDRTTNGSGKISDLTLAEIKELAGYDLPDHPQGYLVKELLKILKANGVLEETVFVLDWPYKKAQEIFGYDLDKVIYCPVIEDKITKLEAHVNEYIEKLSPAAFQFRMASLDSDTYKQLPKILKSGSKAFVAATWEEHTANHSDLVSIFNRPTEGWGWLISQGFRVIETNYPHDLIRYLKSENRH